MDAVDKETRSRMMASIRSSNTRPELLVRKALHSRGFRFRINSRKLPGSPDIVLKKFNAAIFIHGCFWHGHRCSLFRMPASNSDYWPEKIRKNRARDRKCLLALLSMGWRVCIVRECAIRKALRKPGLPGIATRLSSWIRSSRDRLEIS